MSCENIQPGRRRGINARKAGDLEDACGEVGRRTAGEGSGHTARVYVFEESHCGIVPMNHSNQDRTASAESEEGKLHASLIFNTICEPFDASASNSYTDFLRQPAHTEARMDIPSLRLHGTLCAAAPTRRLRSESESVMQLISSFGINSSCGHRRERGPTLLSGKERGELLCSIIGEARRGAPGEWAAVDCSSPYHVPIFIH